MLPTKAAVCHWLSLIPAVVLLHRYLQQKDEFYMMKFLTSYKTKFYMMKCLTSYKTTHFALFIHIQMLMKLY